MGADLSRVVEQNARMPGIVQLFTGLTCEATAEEHPAHSLIAGRYSEFTSILSCALNGMAEEGAARSDAPTDMLAVLMWAVLDGLQTQWQYNRSLDMGAHIRLFWTLVDQAFGPATRMDRSSRALDPPGTPLPETRSRAESTQRSPLSR